MMQLISKVRTISGIIYIEQFNFFRISKAFDLTHTICPHPQFSNFSFQVMSVLHVQLTTLSEAAITQIKFLKNND
jgi:hypothetical protein